METFKKETLQHNHINITSDLEPKDVVSYLVQDGILTDNDVELICNGPTRRERCQVLLSMLPRRGPTAYGAFKQALYNARYDHLGDLLKSIDSNKSHVYSSISKTDISVECLCKLYLPDITGNNVSSLKYDNILNKHCCLLINNIEPKDIIDYFYASGLFSDDQCEMIQKGVTRKDRLKNFLRFLVRLPFENSVAVLLESLWQKYEFIAQEIAKSVQDGTRNGPPEICSFEVAQQANSIVTLSQCDCWSNTDPPSTTTKECKLQDQKCVNNDEVIPKSKPKLFLHLGSVTPYELPNKKLVLAFNYMSSLINQGHYKKFDTTSIQLQYRYNKDADMTCLISYLKASRFLFGNQFLDAKNEIKHAFDLIPKTTNPKYFTVEMFTAKTRMYITQKKLNKLEDALRDVKQIIETDPVGCTGRAAGWLYMNDARSKTAQISLLNLNKTNVIILYNMLHEQAKESFLKGLTNFSKDGGRDGPFGCGFAICRLAILLLRCGDNGLTMNRIKPSAEDVIIAGMYLKNLEESSIPMAAILDMHYRIAKCDYFFRKGNIIRAFEHANSAYTLAKELNLMEFTDHAHNRLLFLKTKNQTCIHSVLEEDQVINFLLEESQ